MKRMSARKLSPNDIDLRINAHRSNLHMRKVEKRDFDQDDAYVFKWFSGDLLIYFFGIGIWMLGTVWLVVRLIDKFF
jgi:hypothetical protein